MGAVTEGLGGFATRLGLGRPEQPLTAVVLSEPHQQRAHRQLQGEGEGEGGGRWRWRRTAKCATHEEECGWWEMARAAPDGICNGDLGLGAFHLLLKGRVARWKELWCVIDGAERKERWEGRIAGRMEHHA